MSELYIQNKEKICNGVKKVCVVLPSYNEEKNIASVIKGIPKDNIDVVVVDDGSVDKTYQLAEENGAFVIKHSKKMGKGAALKNGLAWAMDEGYDYIITMDADGQHDPKEILLFIKEAEKDEVIGIVVGNRLLHPQNMPKIRLYTNIVMSYLVSILCKQKIPDTQCGYKLIKKEVLKKISLHARKFEIESELLIKAAKAGFKISSVPIASIYAQETSNINPAGDTLRFIKFIIKTVVRK